MKRRIVSFVMALVLIAGMVIVPETSVDAATVRVKDLYTKKTANYSTNSKSYLYVNGTKINMSNIPIFMKTGAYMGAVAKIFKNSSLKVRIDELNIEGRGALKLTYGKKVLTISEGTQYATLNGKTTKLSAVPFRAYYTKKGVVRWVVPLWSVCSRLGISYQRSSNGIIKIGGKENTAGEDDADNADDTDGPSDTPTTTSVIKLCIDAGHGGIDSGALGNGLQEKNMNLAIVLSAKKYFDANSRFKVYYTRTADTYPSLTDRSTLANTKKADLFICVHINSATASATGTETLYNPNRLTLTKKNGITSKDLAQSMQTAAVATTGFRNRGLVSRTGLSVLNNTTMPACLIEYGFITNPVEAISMNAGTARYGKALYTAIVNFCKAKKLY